MKTRIALAALLLTTLSFQQGCAQKENPAGGEEAAAEETQAPRGVGTYEDGPELPGEQDGALVARYVKADDSLFERPNVKNGPWHRVTAKSIALMPQNITTPSKYQASVTALEARAVHNGTWIAVVVSWTDETVDKVNSSGQFTDAVAVGFPQGDPKTTSPFMGGPDKGMEIDFWKALWQRDIEDGYQDVTDLHPNITADAYQGYDRDPYKTGPASQDPVEEVLATPESRETLPAVAMGNSMAQITREYPVEQLVAEGFGTLTTQTTQNARAWGVHEDGKWTVVFTRPLDTGDEADAPLSPGGESAVNFAVWEGGEGDVGARKNYAMFTPLKLEATP